MDNPQHYQPLSHALYQQPAHGSSQPIYSSNGVYHRSNTSNHVTSAHHREEEEEEEDDDDGGMVEDHPHLPREDANRSGHGSPKAKVSSSGTRATPVQSAGPSSHSQQSEPEKRRPGRPKGSKNRKNRASTSGPSTTPSQPQPQTQPPPQPQSQAPPITAPQTLHSSSTTTAPPPIPEVTAQNQQYYEFQWRVLNLCAEFYGAAEELVKGTPPLVVAQCYQAGPGTKVDPLVMLSEAKRLANPSRLITNPNPPMLTVVPVSYNSQTTIPSQAGPSNTTNGSAPSTSPPTVINSMQSFVVPLGTQGTYPHSQYTAVYGTQYTPIYQYPSYPPGTAYYAQAPGHATTSTPTPSQPQPQPQQSQPQQPQPQQPQQTQQQPHPSTQPQPQPVSQSVTPSVTPSATTPTATVPSSNSAGPPISNQGQASSAHWSEDEVDKLKRLVEDSRRSNNSGGIDWDGISRQLGGGRTPQQTQSKARQLGLKESSRGVKRRRDTDVTDGASMPPTPRSASTNIPSSVPSNTDMASTASPAPSHTTVTPIASPAIQNRPRPIPPQSNRQGPSPHHLQRSSTTPSSMPSNLPYPMPHVASAAPLIPAPGGSSVEEQQRMSYYRQRSAGEHKQPGPQQQHHHQPPPTPASHPYLYQPNGSTSRMKDK